MARVFITGSSDGLGRMAAQLLIEQGHAAVLHARSEQRGKEALAAVPGAEAVVIGDLSSIAQTRWVADQVNRLGIFDAVIHNAVGYREPQRIAIEDGLPHVFAVNTLAPYILTALIQQPKRLIYLSSGLHKGGDASLQDLTWRAPPLAGAAGLLRQQTARRAARLRSGAPLASRELQCFGTWLGSDQDGRPQCAR
jgi:NAD(P)-dependent dehydrogenase (short-subunit alcohol dehydrogenase family)